MKNIMDPHQNRKQKKANADAFAYPCMINFKRYT